jgi:hypothetical protein
MDNEDDYPAEQGEPLVGPFPAALGASSGIPDHYSAR